MDTCIICGIGVKRKYWNNDKRPRKLCDSTSCRSEFSRRTIANSFAKHGGQITKFRKTNGMHNPEVRARVSKTLRDIGHKPSQQGGNGRGLTRAQKLLSEKLQWPTEVVIKTQKPIGSGYPTCYKIDIANEKYMVAIEVDGYSHGTMIRKEQDAKKDEFLKGLGWNVIRFKNKQVEQNLEQCIQYIQAICHACTLQCGII